MITVFEMIVVAAARNCLDSLLEMNVMCQRIPPRMILMKGHPATGKSTLARALARTLRWPLVDKDDVKDYTLDLANGNEIAYRICWQIAETQLAMGLGVIVDTPLSYPVAYSTGVAIASRQNVPLVVVETQLNETEWRRRFARRASRNNSLHKVSCWQAMQALLVEYDGCWQYPIRQGHHLVVDSARSLVDQLDAVMEHLVQLGVNTTTEIRVPTPC